MNTNHKFTSNRNLTELTDGVNKGLLDIYIHHNHPLATEYLNINGRVITNAVKDHPRTSAFRFDLRLPPYFNDFDFPGISYGEAIKRFIAFLYEQIKKDVGIKNEKWNQGNRKCTPRYIWTKEIAGGKCYHYHFFLFLNKDLYHSLGDYNSNENTLGKMIIKAWERAIDVDFIRAKGLVHFPKNPIHYINQNSETYIDEYLDVYGRASYFAKVVTKTYGDNSRNYGYSLN